MKKSILVTGCSTGIGFYVAKALNDRGYRVFATARKDEDLKKLLDLGLESIYLELSDSQSISAAVEKVIKSTNGKLDCLFNNAGYGQPGAIEDVRRQVLREQFECNVFGTMELTNLLIPIMRKQAYGNIVFCGSMLGYVPLPFRGAYNASKSAIESLSDTLRLELRDTNIAVSLITPGPIKSRFRANAYQKFLDNIDKEHSAHVSIYDDIESRLKNQTKEAPYTLTPDAVYKKLLHAIESKKPKARYYVTFPAKTLSLLKHLLTVKQYLNVVKRISEEEMKPQ